MPRAASTDSIGGIDVEVAAQRTADTAGMAVHDPPPDSGGSGGTSGASRAHDGVSAFDSRDGFGGVHAGFGELHGMLLSGYMFKWLAMQSGGLARC